MDLIPSDRFTIADGRPYNVTPDGIHYHPDTAPSLVRVLERLRRSRSKVRLFLGDGVTGQAWNDEHDVAGTLGNSMGPCKVPLLVERNANGGPQILDHCIVAVMLAPGQFAWKVDGFDVGHWTVTTDQKKVDAKGYMAASFRDGAIIGRHKTLKSAERFVAFMTGQRMAA